jgi:hypothetical protein
MTIGRRKDGRFYPKMARGSATPLSIPTTTSSQRHAFNRTLDKKRRESLRTLENPLLYHNFKEKLERLNPDADIESLIDKTQEPEEALFDIKKKHPEIDIGLKSESQTAEFRQFLDDMGITNERVQNLIAMEDNPLSESELAQLSYVLNNRPVKAIQVDNAMKAPITKDVRKWMKDPARTDLPGVDTPKRES